MSMMKLCQYAYEKTLCFPSVVFMYSVVPQCTAQRQDSGSSAPGGSFKNSTKYLAKFCFQIFGHLYKFVSVIENVRVH